MNEEAAKSLRAPFDPASVGKLPRVTCRDCSDRNKSCMKHTKGKCSICGNYISMAHIHLDYVGHAAVTDRLLAVDPEWSWEPVAFDAEGAPLVKREGREARLWIRLTIAGTTRLGVGIAPADSFELEKQLIGDAIRNAAMRFGVALDLWSKEDLGHDDPGDAAGPPPAPAASPAPATPPPPRPDPTTGEIPEYVPLGDRMASDKQKNLISLLMEERGMPEDWLWWPLPDNLSMRDASRLIDECNAMAKPENERRSTMRDEPELA